MSILEREASVDYAKAKKQADVIIVATILGFCGTRALLAQPFSLDLQDEDGDLPPDDPKAAAFVRTAQRWNLVLGTIEEVLDGLHELVKNNDHPGNLTDDDIHRAVNWGVAPTKDETSNEGRTSTITGRTGADALAPGGRWRRPWNEPIEGKAAEYSGRGAYTGIADDPLRNAGLKDDGDPEHDPRYPTKPYKLDGENGDAEGGVANWSKRYGPATFTAWQFADRKGAVEYGVIHDSNAFLPPVGFDLDTTPTPDGKKVIGYVHGMSQAMLESVRTGPWCVAHEHAIGDATTKLASCFPCTTYMYAAGFPPSSCHLGRGESWVPPQTADDNGNRTASSKLAVETVNTLWAIQVHKYLDLGCKLLQRFFEGDDLHHPNNGYPPVVESVAERLAEFADQELTVMKNGGNLFLDALVFHDKETNRLMNVLGIQDMSETEVADIQRELQEGKSVSMKERRHYAPEWIEIPPHTVKVTNTWGASGALTISFARKSGGIELIQGGQAADPSSVSRNAEAVAPATGKVTIQVTTPTVPIRLKLEDLTQETQSAWVRTLAEDQPYKELSYQDLVYPGYGKHPITYVYKQPYGDEDDTYDLTLELIVEIKKPDKKKKS